MFYSSIGISTHRYEHGMNRCIILAMHGLFQPTTAAWSAIFYIGAAIQGVGGIFTAVFMRTDVQPWARVVGDKNSFDKVSTECFLMVIFSTKEK